MCAARRQAPPHGRRRTGQHSGQRARVAAGGSSRLVRVPAGVRHVRAEAGDTWTYVCVSRHIINVRNTAPCSVESRRRPGHIASAAGATRRGRADAHTPAVRAATGVSVASLAASAIIATAVHDAALTTCQLAGCSVLALLGCCLGAWWLAGRPAAGWWRRGPGSARAAAAARVAAASPPPTNARCCPRAAAAAPRRRAAPSAPLVPPPLASRRHLITSPPLGPPHRSGGGGCLCRCRLAAPGR